MKTLPATLLALLLACCGRTAGVAGDATTYDPGEDHEDDEEACELPFVDGPCDLNIEELEPDWSHGSDGGGWWGPPGEWLVSATLEDVPCGSGSILLLISLGSMYDPPGDPAVGPKTAGVYEIADWVEGSECSLCV